MKFPTMLTPFVQHGSVRYAYFFALDLLETNYTAYLTRVL